MNAERRPDGTEAALVDLAGGLGSETESTGTPPTSPVAESRASEAADRFRNAYAVLVRGKSVRRHMYLSLAAAERTVLRARARGDRADLVLVKLVPVDARRLDEEVTE